jgi:hypothetical protein
MKTWVGLSETKKTRLKLRAFNDPLFFWESPYFCNLELWDYPEKKVSQKDILRTFYSRDPLTGWRKYNELVIQAGMRSSKTFIAGCSEAYEVYRMLQLGRPENDITPGDYFGLAPGSEIFTINVAPKEEQGIDTIYSQFKARIEYNPYFRTQVLGFDPERDIHRKRTNFHAFKLYSIADGCNSQSIVGRTCKWVGFDELNKFKESDTNKASGDKMYNLLSKSTLTFHKKRKVIDGKIGAEIINENIKVIVSSPMHEGDAVHKKILEAPRIPTRLAYQYATWDIHPDHTKESMMDEYLRNPEEFMLHYGGIALGSKIDYFKKKERVKAAMKSDLHNWEIEEVLVEDPMTGVKKAGYVVNAPKEIPVGSYVLSGDPSLRNDAFGICLAHREFRDRDDHYVFDMLLRMIPHEKVKSVEDIKSMAGEIDPYKIMTLFVDICRKVPVEAVFFDTWNFPSVVQAIQQECGIDVFQNTVDKEVYDVLKDIIYRGRADICNFPYVVEKELTKLVLKNGRKVDHSHLSTKDVSDAMANCLFYLTDEWEERRAKKARVKGYVNPIPGFNTIKGY